MMKFEYTMSFESISYYGRESTISRKSLIKYLYTRKYKWIYFVIHCLCILIRKLKYHCLKYYIYLYMNWNFIYTLYSLFHIQVPRKICSNCIYAFMWYPTSRKMIVQFANRLGQSHCYFGCVPLDYICINLTQKVL